MKKIYSFRLSNDGTYYVLTKCNNMDLKEYNIPTKYKGKPVKEIGEDAFFSFSKIKELTIPEGITIIEDRAFDACKGIYKLTLPSTLETIGESAFSRCSSLTSITIPENVTTILDYAFKDCNKIVEVYNLSDLEITKGSSDFGLIAQTALIVNERLDVPSILSVDGDYQYLNIGFDKYIINYLSDKSIVTLPEDSEYGIYNYAFDNNHKLVEVFFSDSVKSVGDYAFHYCNNLENIEISESVKSVGDYAFSECYNLNTIVLPDTITELGKGIFSSCAYLENAYLPNNESITVIKEDTFKSTSIEYFVVEDNIQVIEQYAFASSEVKHIVIPKSVVKIEDYAFGNAAMLNLYYEGTEAEWDEVDLESFNDDAMVGVYIYSEEMPTENYLYWHYNDVGMPEIWANVLERPI